MAANKKDYYFIQVNLRKDDNSSLIDMIKEAAQENEQSLSSFIVWVLKKHFKQTEEENGK
jgi:uncharacterized protein (DUF1778 family)